MHHLEEKLDILDLNKQERRNKMATGTIRIGRESYEEECDMDYFQIEIDGKLKISSVYPALVSETLVSSGDLASALVKNLLDQNINNYQILDGEIIDENSRETRKINRRGPLLVSVLTKQMRVFLCPCYDSLTVREHTAP